jgi:hypothetical protein
VTKPEKSQHAQWPEEGANILGEQFWLFQRSEVTASRHNGPTPHIKDSLNP